MGHELLTVALPLEFEEIGAVYGLSQSKKLTQKNLVSALNEMPDRCFSADETKAVHVHVIGWGLWSGFLQRQLCHAVRTDFNFLQRKWGVPDEAKSFSAKTDEALAGLRLYPFVRRFNCTDVAAYHKSVDDGFKVTVTTPQLVAPECWNYLCYDFFNERYQPNPNPHVNEWHKHNPPPGTAYDVNPRLNHPSLVDRSDSAAWLDHLHQRAPFDWNLNYYLMKTRFNNAPTYAQATELFGASAAYSIQAMTWLAWSVKDKPIDYEILMVRAAEVNPSEYFTLAGYFAERKEDDKAAKYFEKGNAADPDAVLVASHASWLVKYYLKKGRIEDARKAADFAGEVYSFSGLQAKAEFLEATKDYAGAFQWYANIEERYEDSGPVVAFCLRYKSNTGDTRFDAEVKERADKVFPNGVEKVGLGDFSGAPADGVLFKEESDLLRASGLKQGDVIVAAYGVRVHNVAQYNYERDNSDNPELDLIVWQGDGYHEIKASPPNHRFGVDIGNYRKK
jgi:tetratricopeptide (TPR) repeat protein